MKPDGDAVYVTAMDKKTRKSSTTTVYGVPKEKVISDIRDLYMDASNQKHRRKSTSAAN